MKTKNFFDFSRFWLLLKLELFKSRKGVFMTFLITFGLLFFMGMLLGIVTEPDLKSFDHTESYTYALLLGGFILSSLAYSDLGSSLRRYTFLNLPVSTFERFLSMWILTSIVWIVAFTLTYTVYTWVANYIGQLLFSQVTFHAFDPLSEIAITTMKYYFVLQGIFLVGAAHFRGYVFPKTVSVLIVLALVCGTMVYFMLREPFLSEHECVGTECELVDVIGEQPVWAVIKWLFWWVLAPMSWLITYLGLREQEA